MSDTDPRDTQDQSEDLDADKVDLGDYPPDEPMGVGHWGETALEEHMGEPLAERLDAEEPDVDERPLRTDVTAGELVDEDAGGGPDLEKDLVADEVPFSDEQQPTAEEVAVHLVEPEA